MCTCHSMNGSRAQATGGALIDRFFSSRLAGLLNRVNHPIRHSISPNKTYLIVGRPTGSHNERTLWSAPAGVVGEVTSATHLDGSMNTQMLNMTHKHPLRRRRDCFFVVHSVSVNKQHSNRFTLMTPHAHARSDSCRRDKTGNERQFNR